MKKLILFSTLLMTILLTSCGSEVKLSEEEEKKYQYAEDFKEAIDNYEGQRKEVAKTATKALENIEDDLEGATSKNDFKKASKNLQGDWGELNTEIATLEETFARANEASNRHFNELEKYTNTLTDRDTREKYLTKVKDARSRFTIEQKTATDAMNELRNLYADGDDLSKILQIESILADVENDIEKMKQITKDAKALISKLESFTKAGVDASAS